MNSVFMTPNCRSLLNRFIRPNADKFRLLFRGRRPKASLATEPQNKGFTLIELLVVIAIIGAVSSLSTVAFSNIIVSKGVGQAAASISEILELARSEAVTRQTYVWAAFQDSSSSVPELQMVLIYSADGTPNTNASNLVQLSRIVRVGGACLTTFGGLREKTKALLTGAPTPAELYQSTAGITFSAKPSTEFNSKATITFTPRGEAMLLGAPTITTGFDQMIGLGIVAAHGSNKISSGNNDAGVVLDGSTGTNRILRL